MSGNEVKRRKAYYKKATFTCPQKKVLQDLVAKALSVLKDVQHREEQVVSGGQQLRAISGPRSVHGMQVGRLVQYTPGQRASLLELDEKQGDYILTTIAASTDKKKPLEFIESIVYFAIRHNHLMMLSAAPHASRILERHLNWLLDAAGVQKMSDNHVTLSDEIKNYAQTALQTKGAHKIRVGSDIGITRLSSRSEVRNTKRRRLQLGGDAVSAINSFLGDVFGDEPISVPLQRDPVISVDLEITYKSKAKTSEGFAIMQRIATAARHFDEADTVIDLHGGGQLKGDDLKIFEAIQVSILPDSGLIDEAHLYKEMAEWLTRLIKAGMVHSQ